MFGAVVTMLVWAGVAQAADKPMPTADELLRQIDAQMTYDTRTATTRMVVVNPRHTREFVMSSWGRGLDEAAIEYLEPAREKGTRMLRKGDELWMYLPSIERVQKISGHMLREGMMGSDVSYEDMMNNTHLAESYTASVTGEDTVDGRPCWKIELIAKDDTVTYPKRVTCVDEENHIPVRQELFALSGMLLKTWTMGDVRKDEASGKWVPYVMRIEDKLQVDTYTEIQVQEMKFGVDVPDEVFSTRWLER